MSNLKSNKEENRIDAPYHNQFYRIADMLATPCADKRVDALSSMVEARKFSINEISSFVEVWITTQSKFPVLADIYTFTGKKLKNDSCERDGHIELIFDNYEHSEHMARLKALNLIIDMWIETDKSTKLCCFVKQNLEFFFDQIFILKSEYSKSTQNDVEIAYQYTKYRCENNGNKPVKPRNERGVYD